MGLNIGGGLTRVECAVDNLATQVVSSSVASPSKKVGRASERIRKGKQVQEEASAFTPINPPYAEEPDEEMGEGEEGE